MTCEAQSFANRLGVETPRACPDGRRGSPSCRDPDIPRLLRSSRLRRRRPAAAVWASCGRWFLANSAKQSQFLPESLDGNSCVGRKLRPTRPRGGRGETKPISPVQSGGLPLSPRRAMAYTDLPYGHRPGQGRESVGAGANQDSAVRAVWPAFGRIQEHGGSR